MTHSHYRTTWRTITPSTSPDFPIEGTLLSRALYYVGAYGRFAIDEVRMYYAAARDIMDAEYRVRYAETVADKEIRFTIMPRVIATFRTLKAAEEYVVVRCPRQRFMDPHKQALYAAALRAFGSSPRKAASAFGEAYWYGFTYGDARTWSRGRHTYPAWRAGVDAGEMFSNEEENIMDYEAILAAAHTAAEMAVHGMVEDTAALNCGFAWVTIDGKSGLAHFCRKQLRAQEARSIRPNPAHYGSKGVPLGWQFWMPGKAPVQQIDIHEAGARAFRDVLARYNIRATTGSRLD